MVMIVSVWLHLSLTLIASFQEGNLETSDEHDVTSCHPAKTPELVGLEWVSGHRLRTLRGEPHPSNKFNPLVA
jgi:hypothetical protein